MTCPHPDQIWGASAALRARNDPYSTAVAAWLATAARDMALDTARWPRRRPGHLGAFMESIYRQPLAVARAVLDEIASEVAS